MLFAFIETSGWKLIALFDVQIMYSDIQIMPKRKENKLLQLILKSWQINKMDLQRDRDKNCSYWKAKKKKKNLITNTLETTKLKPYVMLGPFQT